MEFFSYGTAFPYLPSGSEPSGTDPTPPDEISFNDGTPIENYTNATWVERYRDPGEFKIVAPLSSGIKDQLPLDSIVSHTDTLEFCIVENHELSEGQSTDPIITISGRSFDAYLEHRVVGGELSYGNTNTAWEEYSIPSDYSNAQAEYLVYDHIINTANQYNSLTSEMYVDSINLPTAGMVVQDLRYLPRGQVHPALVDILSIDDLGVRCVRRNDFGVLGNNQKSAILFHKGNDKSSSVIFTWVGGELQSVDYLFSSKLLKNQAVVQGRWVEVFALSAASSHPNTTNNYYTRVLYVDGSDIDSNYEAMPTETDLTDVQAAMVLRGQQELAKHNGIDIVSAQLTKLNRFKYRQDYDIGDIVSLDGNYGDIEQRRVIEHVEIVDENGFTSYPTLSSVES